MRPQTKPRVLVCALAGMLIAACDNGSTHLVPGGPPEALVTFGDGVLQVLHEWNTAVGPSYLGEALELVRVPADGPLGEKHQLLAAGDLPQWSWLDAVSVETDVVVAWLDPGGYSVQMIRARP